MIFNNLPFRHSPCHLPCFHDFLGLGALGSGFLNLAGNLANTRSQDKNAHKNRQLQREAMEQEQANWQAEFDYNKNLQNQIFEREDSAFQRTVADADSAGLSPLAALNSSTDGSGQAIPAPGGPQFSVTDFGAPQMDLSMLGDMFRASVDLYRDKTSQNAQKDLEHIRQDGENTRLSATLDAQADNIAEQLASNERIANKKELFDLLKFTRQLAQTKTLEQSRMNMDEAHNEQASVQQSFGGVARFKYFYDEKEYQDAMATFKNSFSDFNAINADVLFESSQQSGTESSAASTSAGASLPGSLPGVNASATKSTSASKSFNRDNVITQLYRKFFFEQNNYYPILLKK